MTPIDQLFVYNVIPGAATTDTMQLDELKMLLINQNQIVKILKYSREKQAKENRGTNKQKTTNKNQSVKCPNIVKLIYSNYYMKYKSSKSIIRQNLEKQIKKLYKKLTSNIKIRQAENKTMYKDKYILVKGKLY